MIYLSKGGAGADSDHTWIRPCTSKSTNQYLTGAGAATNFTEWIRPDTDL